ncbi:MAG: discoidin domain-containing protein, partial [Bacilli bacterium]|nr:discoidin domain-containing protein [Bacilli bacterium]
DKEIKKASLDNQLAQNEHLILKRDFVKNVGYDFLQQIVHLNDEYKETVEWLFNDVDNLRLYVMGGTPAGSYYNSIIQLSRLYHEYGDDFKDTRLLNNKWYPNMTYGDLYKKMAITLSLTHSQTVALWMHSGPTVNQSDALRRYAIYKYLHDDGKLRASSKIDVTESFEALKVEEMRFVMNNSIDDEEILWLNAYVKTKIIESPNGAWLTPHPHMAYVWPNYTNPIYYQNDEYFNDLFKVKAETVNASYVKDTSKLGLWDLTFVIPGGKTVKNYEISITKGTIDNKISKVWMNFRNKFGTGAVCGGISKSGSNIRATHGIPATVIGQPGHAALLFYSRNADGKGYWGIDNDVSGWTLSEKGERMLNGWGNASYQKGYSVVYMVLAQEALNDFENYTKSQELVKLANSYSGDKKQQNTIYRKALSVQSINIDAWYGLVNNYLNDETKTEKDYFDLAEDIAEALKHFPLPMYHLTNLLKGKFTSVEYGFRFTLLQTRILEFGSSRNTSNTTEVLQPGVTSTEAKYLLGKTDKTLATFSFDGDNANKIVLAERFNGSGVRWDYSIDGKNNWKEVAFEADDDHKWLLSKSEINAITAENDIYIHIVGTDYSDNNLYKIDITKGTIPSNYFANDLENRVVGVSLAAEWRMAGTSTWTSYATQSPDLTGDKTVEVRIAPTGTQLASDAVTYTFTADNQPDTRKYIPVSNLSIHAVSTEATANQGHATNAIDANYNTRYHSAYNGTDTNRFMVIKLDEPTYVSAVEFVPAGGGNGKIYDGTIYGSMDGENWFVLSQKTGLTYTNQANTIADAITNTKAFEIENPKEVQYVKIVADRTNGNWFTARAFNFYEDVTKDPRPKAGVAFSETNPTNKNVVARLVNKSTNFRITNNNGSDTYTFTENGEFTFEFIDDKTKLTGSAKATVTWIDRVSPTVTVTYNPSKETPGEVLATITPSEAIRVTNYITENVDEDGNQLLTKRAFTYTFTKNGEFNLKFVDAAGNQGSTKLSVDWINSSAVTSPTTKPTTKPTTSASTTNSTTNATTKSTTNATPKSTTKKTTTKAANKTTTTKKINTTKNTTTKKVTNNNTVTNKPQGNGNTTTTTTSTTVTTNRVEEEIPTSSTTTSKLASNGTTTTTTKVQVVNPEEEKKNPWTRYLIVISLAILIMVIAMIIVKKKHE